MGEKAQNLRLLYGLMWGWPGKKLLFMGDEFGQSDEWDHSRSLDWHLLNYPDHLGIQRWVRDLNELYRREKFLAQYDFDSKGFSWAVVDDADNSVLAFFRHGNDGECLLVVCNLTPVVRKGYGIGVPFGGYWREILNSNADYYGGDSTGNCGGCFSGEGSLHGHNHYLNLLLPGLSVLFFLYAGEKSDASY
jgi:1,4-alpha-glucan branching enzyme